MQRARALMPVTSELGVLLGCSVSGLHAKWQAGAEVNAKPLAVHNNGARARAAYFVCWARQPSNKLRIVELHEMSRLQARLEESKARKRQWSARAREYTGLTRAWKPENHDPV